MRVWALWIGFAGCQPPDEDPKGGSNDPDPDDTESPAIPSECGEEVVVGAGGGVVSATGIRLELPSGALEEDLAIQLCPVDPLPETEPVGAVWELRPTDIALLLPATVTLEGLAEDGAALFVPGPDAASVLSLQSSRPFAGSVEGPVYRFGAVYAALDPRRTEPYVPPARAIDVLFVVDDSGSMQDNQAKLAEEFVVAMPLLLGSGADFRVGVVTTDADSPQRSGKLVEVDGTRWVDASTPDVAEVFGVMAQPGINGSGNERGLEAAYAALESLRDTFNAGFQRADADLAIVVVSDEDDATRDTVITVDEFIVWLPAMRLAPNTATLHAIVNPPGGGPLDTPGLRYIEVAQATGGETVSIGAASWSPVFERLADVGPAGFVLPVPAVDGSVEGWWVPSDEEPTLLPTIWDPVENRVTVDARDYPPAEIVVLFEPA